MEQPLSNRE